MSVTASIVIRFGEGVSSSAWVMAELDGELNVDANGEEISDFAPGDEVHFLVQHNSSLRIGRVAATDGTIAPQGTRSVARLDQLTFQEAAEAQELSAYPSGAVAHRWYGRNGQGLKVAGRQASVTGAVPCLVDLAYMARMHSYKLAAPNVVLAEGESYPVTIVIYMEAIA